MAVDEGTPMKKIPLLLPLILASALVACGSPDSRGPAADAVIGRQAPELTLQWLDGSAAGSLTDLRGRVVLLEFWRTW